MSKEATGAGVPDAKTRQRQFQVLHLDPAGLMVKLLRDVPACWRANSLAARAWLAARRSAPTSPAAAPWA